MWAGPEFRAWGCEELLGVNGGRCQAWWATKNSCEISYAVWQWGKLNATVDVRREQGGTKQECRDREWCTLSHQCAESHLYHIMLIDTCFNLDWLHWLIVRLQKKLLDHLVEGPDIQYGHHTSHYWHWQPIFKMSSTTITRSLTHTIVHSSGNLELKSLLVLFRRAGHNKHGLCRSWLRRCPNCWVRQLASGNGVYDSDPRLILLILSLIDVFNKQNFIRASYFCSYLINKEKRLPIREAWSHRYT